MIKHYLKTAFRNLWKYKTQSVISIIGLALGISFFTIGYQWLKYETSYDDFHLNSERIYKIYAIDKKTGKKQNHLPLVLAKKLEKEFPEVENVTVYFNQYMIPMFWGDKDLGYPEFRFVDEQFFNFFPPIIIKGQTDHLLASSGNLIVTEDFTRKYWSSPEEAIGNVFTGGFGRAKIQFTIVAVMANPPVNSKFQGEGFTPDVYNRMFNSQVSPDREWFQMYQEIYVLLHKSVEVKTFEQKLRNYAIDNGYNKDLILQVANISEARYLIGSDLSFNISYIYTFVGAGLLLMFCALFNFLNLYINRMLQRSREIKLRKTVGADNSAVIKLFQIELIVQLLLTFALGIVLLISVIPIFEQKFETQIIKSELITNNLIVSVVTFAIIFIFCLLSELKFARFSRLTQSSGRTANYKSLRNVSICIQLAICVFFIMSAFIFFRQVSLMNHFDWGFNSKGLIKFTMNWTMKERENITKDIAQLPLVKYFTGTDLFQISKEPTFTETYPEMDGKEIEQPLLLFNVDEDFINTFEIPLIEGRGLEEGDLRKFGRVKGILDQISNTKVLVTENFAKLLNKENIIGEVIRVPENTVVSDGRKEKQNVEIVGIVKDFHTSSLQNETFPVILQPIPGRWRGNHNYIKVDEGREREAIAAMERIFAKYDTDISETPIELVDDILYRINKSENSSLQLFLLLAVLCIIIAIFGIYSISSSNMERRKKEIAIRKISGATAKKVVGMFLMEYSRLLIIANLVALPLAYLFMSKWLAGYIYKITIEFWMFLPVFIFTLGIVILTVLAQVIRTANADPAEVVKSE
ncbi:MAG: ABC transporter permease [Bacteroidales bacterium]|jgi:ABC-type antimicrobial peptide transport system permease subunit|nr:ABC transporter permease [Bacteroidales bacterium]